MEFLTQLNWSPYAVGIGIGILSWFTFLISGKPLASSTSFARTSGMIEKLLRGDKVAEKPYYQKTEPKIEWQWMLVLGIAIGAFISAAISGDLKGQWVPALWASAFGEGTLLRLLVALIGGIFLGFGARWGSGCTSGHGISGTLQLAVSSWISAICFFSGGIIAAWFIYHVIA